MPGRARWVAVVLALWMLCGTTGGASTPSVSMWTWMKRAFAPASHHRRGTGSEPGAAHVAEAPMELYGVVQHEGSFEGGHCAPRPARA